MSLIGVYELQAYGALSTTAGTTTGSWIRLPRPTSGITFWVKLAEGGEASDTLDISIEVSLQGDISTNAVEIVQFNQQTGAGPAWSAKTLTITNSTSSAAYLTQGSASTVSAGQGAGLIVGTHYRAVMVTTDSDAGTDVDATLGVWAVPF